tara:strand:+ start:201 stop:992 length:792 start_codon:yes stop_codon:yes gene_type:complete
MKTILLTFDVEEFDLPREFSQKISDEEMYKVSKQGLEKLISLLETYKAKATFFITANFAKKYPKLIKKLQNNGHEIACHGYCHSDSYTDDISKIPLAKKEIEKIITKKIKGFRAPRFEIKKEEISNTDFHYDSSSHPTIAPGKYFNILEKKKIHRIGDIIEIPLSTLPLIPFLRAPINWYMFRHFPKIYRISFAKINFFFSDYLMLVFHPWEFANLEKFNLPWQFKKGHGEKLLKKLEYYIKFCKKNNYQFETIEKFLENQVL